MRPRGVLTGVLAAVATSLPAPIALTAQGAGERQTCDIEIREVISRRDTTRLRMYTSGTGERITYIGGGVDATCRGQGNRLLADSAEHYSERGLLLLFHNVRYTESRMQLTADRMTYHTNDDRLVAIGNVRGRTESGTRFTGPEMEYFRAKPGVRSVSRWRAPGRPVVRMSPSGDRTPDAARRDSLGNVVSDSVDITADLIISENDSLVWASGDVVIERPDLRATADSALLDNGTEFARLMRDPVIVGNGERPFRLVGTVIDLWSEDRQLTRVLASGEGEVESDSLTLRADTIDLRLREQRMERVHAWGGRAHTESPDQRIDADSLDILMPGQRLREVRALGTARAVSRSDTARIARTSRTGSPATRWWRRSTPRPWRTVRTSRACVRWLRRAPRVRSIRWRPRRASRVCRTSATTGGA
jgi:lipopolysaccharide export system protein LptA